MKLVSLIITVILVIATVKCHLTSSTKRLDLTTISPTQIEGQNVSNDGEKKKLFRKTLDMNESQIYLDDVLFALKNQNWTDQELPCLHKTLLLLHGLQNFTLWSVWDWDSIASQPQGLLYGSRYHLGNFDECMNAPWYQNYPELRTQYCLADIELERTDKTVKKIISNPYDPYQSALNVLEFKSLFHRTYDKLTWAVCVPAVCQPRSVERLMAVLLSHSHLSTAGLRARISVKEKCQKVDEPLLYDGLFYGFVGMAVFLASLTVIFTYVKHKSNISEINTLTYRVTAAFDLKSNAKELLKVSDNGLGVLYGIKFLSMCIIVSAHQFGITNGGPVSNGYTVDQDVVTVIGMLMLHEDVVVDSYFVLSGFLTGLFLMQRKRLPNIFLVLLKRYMRLTIAFAIVIFYVSAIYPYTGTGPLWNRAIAEDTDKCRKNWWLSLLMLNNYIDSENICIVVSWYIPCDFHFFVITVLMYYLYKKQRLLGKLSFAILALASVITPGVINYIYSLPAIQLFTYDFISNPRGPLQFHMTYIKSHTRYATYLVGFFASYLFIYCSNSNNYKKVPQKWSTVGALLSIIIMFIIIFTGSLFLWRNYNVLESAIYAAVNRPVWACSITLLILTCSLGHVPIIKGFLSWYPWVPLSRLSYGLYLVHTVLIARNVYVTRNLQHHDNFNIITSSLGTICQGCLFSLIIWLIAEAPIINLVNLCIAPRSRGQQDNENTEKSTEVPSTTDGCRSNSGYIEDNLQPTLQVISSKM